MTNCTDLAPLLARATGPAPLGAADRQRLDAHLAECAACRAALDEQAFVAGMLGARLPVAPEPRFAARLAERLDAQTHGGWLDLADWRTWTAGLMPVAAGLMLAVYLGLGAPAPAASDTAAQEGSFAAFTVDASEHPATAALLQPSISSDTLLETLLTGAPPVASGAPDVR